MTLRKYWYWLNPSSVSPQTWSCRHQLCGCLCSCLLFRSYKWFHRLPWHWENIISYKNQIVWMLRIWSFIHGFPIDGNRSRSHIPHKTIIGLLYFEYEKVLFVFITCFTKFDNYIESMFAIHPVHNICWLITRLRLLFWKRLI